MRKSPNKLALSLLLLVLILLDGSTFAEDHSAAALDHFEKRIRPLLVEHCYKCHSAESEKLKGGLRVDTKTDLARGGDTGECSLIAGRAGDQIPTRP